MQTTPTDAANFAPIDVANFEARDLESVNFVHRSNTSTSTDPTYFASVTTVSVDLPNTDDANVTSRISADAEPL